MLHHKLNRPDSIMASRMNRIVFYLSYPTTQGVFVLEVMHKFATHGLPFRSVDESLGAADHDLHARLSHVVRAKEGCVRILPVLLLLIFV